MKPQLSTETRIVGSLLAAACGDALGATNEFGPATTGKRTVRDLVGGGAFNWQPGETTDDTATLVATAAAYTQGDGSCYPVRAAMALRMWLNTNPKDVGNQTRGALSLVNSAGIGWRDSGRIYQQQHPGAAGNGSLMRIASVGLARQDYARIADEASMLGNITHADTRCTAACRAFSHILSQMVDGADARVAVKRAREEAWSEAGPILDAALSRQDPYYPTITGAAQGFVLLTFEVAVRALLRATRPEHLEREIIHVANAGGDTDTNATCAGALLGARWGIDAIPPRWLTVLMPRRDLQDLGRLLTSVRARG